MSAPDYTVPAQFGKGFLMSRHYDEDIGALCGICFQLIEDSSVRIDMGDMDSYINHRSCYEDGLAVQQGRGKDFQKATGRDKKSGPDPFYT